MKFCLALLLSYVLVLSAAVAEDVFVQVKSTNLRSEPQIISRSMGDLSYGERLSSLGTQGSWVRVKTSKGAQGFVHLSALSSKQIVFSNTASKVAVNRDDIVLAGKGFSRAAEDGVSRQNPSLNFHAVDAMERSRVSPEELRAFVMAGKLNG